MSQFWFLCLVTIFVFEFCHNMRYVLSQFQFWVLSQFEDKKEEEKKALAGQTMALESIWTIMVLKRSIHKKRSKQSKTVLKKINNSQKQLIRSKMVKISQNWSTTVKYGQYCENTVKHGQKCFKMNKNSIFLWSKTSKL